MQQSKKYCIIGASAAGIAAIKQILILDPSADITCFSREVEDPYNRCLLADTLMGEKNVDDIRIFQHSVSNSNAVKLIKGISIVSIDRTKKIVESNDGKIFSYDVLLIATGASPRPLSCVLQKQINGIFEPYNGCFQFYHLADIVAMRRWISVHKPQQALVIGAGLTGIEAADALRINGLQKIVIVEKASPLGAFLGPQGQDYFISTVLPNGVQLYLQNEIIAVQLDRSSNIRSVQLHNEDFYNPVQMIVSAIGAIPNNQLAVAAGILCSDQTIIVDQYMRTNDDAIWAAGDVVTVACRFTGMPMRSTTWPDAVQQGMVAGHQMVNGNRNCDSHYKGGLNMTQSEFFGTSFSSMGYVGNTVGYYEHEEITLEGYVRTVSACETGQMVGFVTLGKPSLSIALRRKLLTAP